MPMHHHMQGRASSAVLNRPYRAVPVLVSRHSLGALPFDRETLDVAVLLRHSAPVLSRSSSASSSYSSSSSIASPSASKLPHALESVLTSTDVHVTGVAQRDGHCVFHIEVDAGWTTHVLNKRYSEIRDFRNELLQLVGEKKRHGGHGPCVQLAQLAQIKFPRRRLRLPGVAREANLAVAQQRIKLLERFLQAMLRVYRMATRRQLRVCVNAHCIVLGKIKRFLDVSEPVLVEHESDEPAVDDLRPTAGAGPPAASRTFPDLAFTTLCGDKPAPLFPIAEDPEPMAASD